jgi:hypothetical protein
MTEIDDLIRAVAGIDAEDDPPDPPPETEEPATVGNWGAGAVGARPDPTGTMDQWLKDQWMNQSRRNPYR